MQLQLNLPDTAIWIKSDAKSLKQILINLLSNAIKFTKEGYIALSLIELSETTNQAEYQISIKDTGIGITTEQETRLFQRYEQANTNTANHYGGSGLGLSISLELAKLLGGRIDVHSQFGEGTIFTLTMLVEKLSEQEKKSILSSQNRMIENVQFDPLNMQSSQPTLIVENNSINQEILKRILTNAGYFCEVAINGQAAVEKYQVFPYRLIWMDIEMPEMNGYEATQAIRKIEQKDNRSPAYIICLSANNSDESKAQARDSGMNHYLTKPFKKQEILNLLAQVNQEINLLPMLKQQKNFSVKHEEKMFINSTQQTELIKIVELDEKKNTNGLQIKTKKRKKSLEFWLTSDTQKKINLVAKRENNLN